MIASRRTCHSRIHTHLPRKTLASPRSVRISRTCMLIHRLAMTLILTLRLKSATDFAFINASALVRTLCSQVNITDDAFLNYFYLEDAQQKIAQIQALEAGE